MQRGILQVVQGERQGELIFTSNMLNFTGIPEAGKDIIMETVAESLHLNTASCTVKLNEQKNRLIASSSLLTTLKGDELEQWINDFTKSFNDTMQSQINIYNFIAKVVNVAMAAHQNDSGAITRELRDRIYHIEVRAGSFERLLETEERNRRGRDKLLFSVIWQVHSRLQELQRQLGRASVIGALLRQSGLVVSPDLDAMTFEDTDEQKHG